MPQFGKKSIERLSQVHPDLVRVLTKAIEGYDFTVICGHRGQEEQDKAFAEGKSKLKWPNGNHNKLPSLAVDIAPWPIPESWGSLPADASKLSRSELLNAAKDFAKFYHLMGYIKGIGDSMGIKLRFGIDWDSDGDFKNNKFDDAPHVELVRSEALPTGDDEK